MATDPNQDQFLEEVLGLFALEAQEWLSQTDCALAELERGPAPERTPRLFEAMVRGLTNLGGSAATVELPAIEKLTFALLPLLQAMQSGGGASREQFLALHDGLDALTAAVQNLATSRTATIADLDRALARIAQATAARTQTVHPPNQPDAASFDPTQAAPTLTLLDALQALQTNWTQSLEPTRNLVEVVLQKARSEPDQGTRAIDGSTIRRILKELESLDEQLLAEAERRVPAITQAFAWLKSGSADVLANGKMELVLQEVRSLHTAARSVEATAIAQFLEGLQTFFTIAARQRALISPERLDAVQARLAIFVPMVQQWVTLGCNERVAIEQVLQR